MMRIIRGIVIIGILVFSTAQAPNDPAGPRLLQDAQALFEAARYDEALQIAQTALVTYADSGAVRGQCLLLLGNIFLETGQWDAARQQFNTALRLFEKYPEQGRLNAAQAHNNLGEFFYKKADYAQAETAHRMALQIRETALGKNHQLVADSYNNLGNCRAARGDYASATQMHQRALDIRQKVLPTNHPDRATSHNNLGNCAYLSGDYGNAQQQFRQALELRMQVFGPKHPKTAQVLNNLGNACVALGQHQAAIGYYQQALHIRRQHFGDQHAGVASALENIADLYSDRGDQLSALDLYRQAYSIQEALQGKESPAAASLWHKIGLCYQYEGDYPRALEHHRAAEPVLSSALGKNHPYLAGLYNNIGNCLASQKNFPAALVCYREALHRFRQNQPLPYPGIALVYNNIGASSLETGQAQEALQALDQALKALQASPYAYPAERAVYLKNKGLALEKLGHWPEARLAFEEALLGAETAEPVVQLEIQMAWTTLLCRRQMTSGDTSALQHSVQALEQALALGDSLRNQLLAPGARQRWLDQRAPALGLAMEMLHRLWVGSKDQHFAERAFALAERNQSLQLLEQLRKEQAGRFAGIPDSLLEQERDLAEQLNQLEKQNLAAQHAGDSAELQTLDLKIADSRQAYQQLLRRFETNYPEYYRLQHDQQTATPAAVRQHLLQKDQALVEYFSGDSALFVFVLTAERLQFLRLALDFPLLENIRQIRHSLQAYPTATSATAARLASDFTVLAHGLYTQIFAPLEISEKLPSKLIIVPDGALAYLPFECLLRQKPADYRLFKNHDYLLRHFQIAYAHSATQQLASSRNVRPSSAKTLLAIAPDYDNQKFGLRPLLNNRPEAQAVQAMFEGDLFAGNAATVSRFLEAAGRYNILLLATHGQASSTVGELSYLAFSTADTTANPFLYARDLYTRHIPAEMVVLSACETSLGEYRTGQGVISLSKGFSHAGARSVLATLWSIDDAKHAELVQQFFQHIKNGQSKDKALRQAKLDFLETHPHDEAYPVYWAAMTAYGDMQALQQNRFWWWWLGLAGLGLLVIFFWWKKTGYYLRTWVLDRLGDKN